VLPKIHENSQVITCIFGKGSLLANNSILSVISMVLRQNVHDFVGSIG